MFEGGRVTGVIAAGERGDLRIRARLGVLLNAGGFSRNLEMRQRYLPAPQESVDYSLVNPGDTGEIMQIAIDAGAALDQMNEAWWIVGGVLPNGMAVSHTIDLSKPHCIMVDASGERYVNEAMAYMELGQTMYARQSKAGSIPSWAIFDSRHRERYTWGMAMPGEPPREWLECGYMQRADSLRELAQKCDLDPRKLAATVERFNGFASSGVDADFGRGSRAYERMNGDPTCKPNPTLGSIERPPFHAVRIFVGDVGTCGGLVTDEHGRVLQTDGAAIPGLYACGNIAANCMGRSYPGPGITLGQSMIFGYRAARHALAGGR
jgi:3-oxosteroid 1-dehydrogenase